MIVIDWTTRRPQQRRQAESVRKDVPAAPVMQTKPRLRRGMATVDFASFTARAAMRHGRAPDAGSNEDDLARLRKIVELRSLLGLGQVTNAGPSTRAIVTTFRPTLVAPPVGMSECPQSLLEPPGCGIEGIGSDDPPGLHAAATLASDMLPTHAKSPA